MSEGKAAVIDPKHPFTEKGASMLNSAMGRNKNKQANPVFEAELGLLKKPAERRGPPVQYGELILCQEAGGNVYRKPVHFGGAANRLPFKTCVSLSTLSSEDLIKHKIVVRSTALGGEWCLSKKFPSEKLQGIVIKNGKIVSLSAPKVEAKEEGEE